MAKKYTAKKGDTWESLAKALQSPINTLMNLNPGANQLYPGVVLNTPPPPTLESPYPSAPSSSLPTGANPYSSTPPAAPTGGTPTPTNPIHSSVLNLYGETPASLTDKGWTFDPTTNIWYPPGTSATKAGGTTTWEYDPAANYSGGGAYPYEWGGPAGPTAKGRNKNYGQGGKGKGSGRMELASPASNYRVEVTAENAAQYPGVPIGTILVRNTIAYAPYGQWIAYNPDGSLWTPGQTTTTEPGIVEPPYTGYNYYNGYNGWQGAYPGYYTPTFSKTGRKKSTPEGLITWRR